MTEAVHPSRKPGQPYLASQHQPWSANLLESQHQEALYAFGELVLFTLMWRPADFEEGRVNHCPVCYAGNDSRYAKAFDQPTKRECEACFGTTFEGGFRAQVVRPVLLADRNVETTEVQRGVVSNDTIRFETTGDFTLRKDDYLFRADNSRFQVEERNEDVMRDGFGSPPAPDSMAGSSTAHMEEITTVAFKISPTTPAALRSLLGHRGPFHVDDLSASDLVKPQGYV
jgi:hypothetical protein